MRGNRFFQSLSGQILFYVVFPTIVILFGVIVYNNYKLYTILRAESEHSIQMLAEVVAAEIERGNTRAALAPHIMALAQQAGQFGDRGESVEFSRLVLENLPEFTGSYFGYEPNADQSDYSYLQSGGDPAVSSGLSDSGRFIPYWFIAKDGSGAIKLEPLVDMETSLYYDGCKKQFLELKTPQIMITEPYEYEGKMIVEQTFPLVENGDFKGVAGVDRALDNITEFLAGIKAKYEVDLFLISKQGRFVAATTISPEASDEEKLNAKQFQDTPYGALFADFYRQKKASLFRTLDDPIDGEPYYFVSSPIKTGEWVVIVRKSVEQTLAPIMKSFTGIILISIGSGIVVFVLAYLFTLSISRRVQNTARLVDTLASGDLSGEDQDEVEETKRDEIGKLVKAVYQIRSNLKDVISDIQDSSSSVLQSSEKMSDQSLDVSERMKSLSALSTEASQSAQDVQNRITGMAAAIEETSVSSNSVSQSSNEISQNLDSIAAAVEQSSANMNTMSSSADSVSKTVNQIAKSVEDNSSAMQSISKNAASAATFSNQASDSAKRTFTNVERLGSSAEAISKVVEIIRSIASQTNLLALNASIEAASAGDAGKGFAVVANEVKELARQTAESTEEIRSQVEDIQTKTRESISDITNFVDIVKEINEVFSKISSSVDLQTDRSNDISKKIQSVAEEIEGISNNIHEAALGVNEISKNVTTGVQEVNSISRNLKELVQGIGEIAKSANNLSQFMNDVVDNFHSVSETSEKVVQRTEAGLPITQQMTEVSERLNQLVSRFSL